MSKVLRYANSNGISKSDSIKPAVARNTKLNVYLMSFKCLFLVFRRIKSAESTDKKKRAPK